MWRKCLSVAALSGCLFCAGRVQATLLYQYTFDGATPGTPAVTAGGGNLAITNSTNGHVAFNGASGGIVGGNLDATSGQTYNTSDPAGIAATSASGGSNLTGLTNSGVLNQFTVTFWMKGTTAGMNASNFPRLFILGPSTISDLAADGTADNFGVELRSDKLDVEANGQLASSASAQGNTLAANTWNFIALTYDGTSSTAFNSTAQQALAGDSHNVQLYEGTDTTSVTRFGVGAAKTTDFTTNVGPISFGTNAALLLANRLNLSRGFNGQIDDFRIYDSLLSPSDTEAIRVADGGLVPEPASLGLIGVSALAMLRRRKHGSN
jgi:PEP-CTERM motif